MVVLCTRVGDLPKTEIVKDIKGTLCNAHNNSYGSSFGVYSIVLGSLEELFLAT